MARTTIPVSVLEREDGAVIATLIDLYTAEAGDQADRFVDLDDPSTLPEEWR